MSISTTTAVFDDRLVDYLPGIHRQQSILRQWVREQSPHIRSELAVASFSFILARFGRNTDILDMKKLRKLETIADNICRFEGLIGHIRTRFGNKIYRDHLDHMLRTALISSYLARRLGLTGDDREDLALASLFHDAGYPVQEAGEILESITIALKKGYSLLSFGMEHGKPAKTPACMGELANSYKSITLAKLLEGTSIKAEHATIGAFEFLECCRSCSERALRIAAAICMHSSEFCSEVSYGENSLAVLLTLADELQDWGRPVAYPDGSSIIPMNELQNLDVQHDRTQKNKKLVSCDLIYGNAEFPLLDVLFSKYMNLRRLRLEEAPFNIELRFPLQHVSHTLDMITFPFITNLMRPFVLEKGSKRPWVFAPSPLTRYSSTEFANYLGLDIQAVHAARESIQKLSEKGGLESKTTKWSLWRCGQSHDYLVVDSWPEMIDIVSKDDRIRMRLSRRRKQFIGRLDRKQRQKEKKIPQYHFGDLIDLSRPPSNIRIPVELKPLPVILRVKDVPLRYPRYHYASPFVQRKRVPIDQTKVYWFRSYEKAMPPTGLYGLLGLP